MLTTRKRKLNKLSWAVAVALTITTELLASPIGKADELEVWKAPPNYDDESVLMSYLLRRIHLSLAHIHNPFFFFQYLT